MRRDIYGWIAVALIGIGLPGGARGAPLRVVTTLPDYAVIAKAIGGDRVETRAIVKGEQDAHFIRPKPSFVDMVREADVLIGETRADVLHVEHSAGLAAQFLSQGLMPLIGEYQTGL